MDILMNQKQYTVSTNNIWGIKVSELRKGDEKEQETQINPGETDLFHILAGTRVADVSSTKLGIFVFICARQSFCVFNPLLGLVLEIDKLPFLTLKPLPGPPLHKGPDE